MQIQTAQEIQLGDARVTARSPVALWLLAIVTLGVYMVIWWYQVNRELRDYARAAGSRHGGSPVLATVLMALYPLGLIPPLVTVALTTTRLRREQGRLDMARIGANPIFAVLLVPVFLGFVIYVQRGFNALWFEAERKGLPS